MGGVDIFIAAYLICIIVILAIFSTLAYNKQVKNGKFKDE